MCEMPVATAGLGAGRSPSTSGSSAMICSSSLGTERDAFLFFSLLFFLSVLLDEVPVCFFLLFFTFASSLCVSSRSPSRGFSSSAAATPSTPGDSSLPSSAKPSSSLTLTSFAWTHWPRHPLYQEHSHSRCHLPPVLVHLLLQLLPLPSPSCECGSPPRPNPKECLRTLGELRPLCSAGSATRGHHRTGPLGFDEGHGNLRKVLDRRLRRTGTGGRPWNELKTLRIQGKGTPTS